MPGFWKQTDGNGAAPRGERLRRAAPWAVAAAVAAGLALWFWPQPPPPVPRATAADCHDVTIWTNGFHTDLEFAADLLPPSHPLRRLHPTARRLQLGWGDKAFYQSEGTDMLLGAQSLLPGGAVTIHLLDSPGPPIETLYYPSAVARIAISDAGAQRLGAFIAGALVLNADGLPVVERAGHLPGRSLFLAARGDFHALRVCNHWTADALRQAGVPVQSRWAWSGKGLTAAAERLAPGPCQALAESD